jgi:hypothetical protein
MGLQILNFPSNGIQGDGNWNQFGGSRAIGTGLLGQGNLLSGNGNWASSRRLVYEDTRQFRWYGRHRHAIIPKF